VTSIRLVQRDLSEALYFKRRQLLPLGWFLLFRQIGVLSSLQNIR